MKYAQTILNGIFIAVLLGVAGLFLATLMPIPGNIEIKIVKSGSMEPFIRTGGIVIIKPETSYQLGDVITFGKDSKTEIPTTHRIAGMKEENGVVYYTTKGDANEEADPNQIVNRDIIGKMIFTVPYAGFILDFAKKPVGFVFLIAIPAALVIFYEIIAMWNEIKTLMRRRKDRNLPDGGHGDGETKEIDTTQIDGSFLETSKET